ncbi:HIT family protein [Alphaproteobacteria bacterium]|nr:HIT family protein [Alphaproteobacteria bacterium]
MFKLDNRLENDSFFMQEIKNFQIRLMNVQEFFWIVLIPIKPNLIELSDLEVDERNKLLNFAVDLGNYIKSVQNFDKVNIGMLGNVVSQLHLHLVLRNKDDPAWPGAVWGWKSTSNLNEETKQIRSNLIFQYLK